MNPEKSRCHPRTGGLLLAALLLAGLGAVCAVAAEVVNRVVLRVNDRIATLYDYQLSLADRLRQIRSQPGIPEAERERLSDEAPKMVMKEILDELLILSRADQLGIVASELEIEDAIGRMRERAGVETDEQFRLALAQSGLTIEELRENTRRQLAWDEVIGREILPRIELSDEDLRRYYDDHAEEFRVPEKIRVEEIVVLSEETPVPDSVESLANEIRARLEQGESFEEITEAYDEAVSAVIDVGWVAPGDLAPVIEEALWPLPEGALSEPIAGRGGLHIARLLERSEATVEPFEDVKEAIRRRERQRLYAEEAEEYLLELEEKALIVGNVPEEAAGFRRAAGRPLLADQYEFFEAATDDDDADEPLGIETIAPEAPPDGSEP